MYTFASRRLNRIISSCIEIAQKAAQNDGYVPMHNLVALFDCEVVFRPLLVEAVISRNTNLSQGGCLWKIFLDGERFSKDAKIFKVESSRLRLSARARNTIAHELIHTFQFKIENDEIVADHVTDKKSRSDAIVRFLEKEAHELTSLLLIPRRVLNDCIKDEFTRPNASSIADVFSNFGTSREVFIQALNYLKVRDEDSRILNHTNIKDVFVGIGSWDDTMTPYFKLWPKFVNFFSKSLPDFIRTKIETGSLSFNIPDLPSDLVIFGGTKMKAEIIAYEGSRIVPNHRRVVYEFSVEKRIRKVGMPYLFMIRKIAEVEKEASSIEFPEGLLRENIR